MNSSALIHAVIDGVLTGSVYALMATGLTLIFGVMDIINVAQGILVILGAYLSYALSVHWGIDPFVGLVITIPTLFVVGIVVERAFIGRLKGPEKTAMSILVTYAISLVIEGSLEHDLLGQLRADSGFVREPVLQHLRCLLRLHLRLRLHHGGRSS